MTNTKLLSDPEGTSVRLISQDYFDLGRKITIPLRQKNVAKVLPLSGGYDANGGSQFMTHFPRVISIADTLVAPRSVSRVSVEI